MENILNEEISYMKKLFETKGGFLISEQAADPVSDAGAVLRQLDAFNTNEQEIVNILKKYKTKQEFQSFLDTYKKIKGVDFAEDVFRGLTPFSDKTEWADLTKHLSSMGITLGWETINRGNASRATFKGIQQAPPVETRQGNINNIFCSVKGGKIDNPGSQYNGTTWEQYNKTYKATPQEIEAAKKSCPNAELSKSISKKRTISPGQNQQNVNQRFANTAKTLGSQTGNMDLQSLQTILKTLESGQLSQTPTAGTTTNQNLGDLQKTIDALNKSFVK